MSAQNYYNVMEDTGSAEMQNHEQNENNAMS